MKDPRRIEHLRDMARQNDDRPFYLWVLFDWSLFDPKRAPNWEPASFDPLCNAFALIGSRQVIPASAPCIADVGDVITGRPS